MSLPARSGLVNLGEVFEISSRRFKPNDFSLDYDDSMTRMRRAADANIRGEDRILLGTRNPRAKIVSVGSFRVDTIKKEMSVGRFLNNPNRRIRNSIPADIDQSISFIAKYPEYARRHILVCFNTNLFGSAHDFPLIVAFMPLNKGFEVVVLERDGRLLIPGDLILTRK